MKTLGEKIRYVRNLRGWSQEEVADKLNISLPAYSKIERNKTDVSFSRLNQVADVLKITLIDLLSLSPNGSEQFNLQKLLAEKENEIIKLQSKLIELLELKSPGQKKIDGHPTDDKRPAPNV
jgi:transcriptional regulator with XRE-family HTH domain